MADRKQPDRPEAETAESSSHQPRPFWSGIITFGLVSLPVSLFPAHRGKSFSLKMVGEDGTPLGRRYVCEKDGKVLERDEIVRGYPLDPEGFVVVEDEELEALAPEKSREIDLRRFVPIEDIDPVFFERGYFLAPDSEVTKAYRLLARSMEEARRAGIATFVMREREYIIAIIAERGILRAETLRFEDEIRSAEDVGLPALSRPDQALVKDMKSAMQALAAERLDRDLLADPEASRALRLVEKKRRAGEDLVHEAAEAQAASEDDSNVIDLMEVLRQRLQGRPAAQAEHRDAPRSACSDGEEAQASVRRPRSAVGRQRHSRREGASAPSRKAPAQEFELLSRDELYERAREAHITGRSKMTRQQLVQALKDI